MSETTRIWSAKPFVSHDGPDDNGYRAEVKVGIGHAPITDIKEKGKAIQVTFGSNHPDYAPSAWVPLGDPLESIVREVYESGEGVDFRIETKRKAGIDRTEPILELSKTAELSRKNCGKSLVAIKRDDSEEPIYSPMALTNEAEDPSTGLGVSARNMSPEDIKKAKANNAPANYSQHNGIEPPPYQTYNSNGEVNPGSIAVGVPLNIYNFLTEYFKKNELKVEEKHKIQAVNAVLDACNKAQLAIYGDELEKPDLSLGSHSRARAEVYESIENVYPLTDEIITNKEQLNEWAERTTAKILKKWQWGIKIVEKLNN